MSRFVLPPLLVPLALLACAPAASADPQPKAACWFYTYQWAVQYMVPNVNPPTTYAKEGMGTGMFVTDGRQPTDDEIAALTAALAAKLPRGDAEAPPPAARVSGMAPVACPPRIAPLSAATAKIILGQPAPVPRAAAAPGTPPR